MDGELKETLRSEAAILEHHHRTDKVAEVTPVQ